VASSQAQGAGRTLFFVAAAGTLSDLRSILAAAGPDIDMIGKTFETTLSLKDPHTRRQFVRGVGINLGLHVKPGELKASVQPPDDTVIAVVLAYQRHNAEAWHGLWSARVSDV